MLNQHWRGIMSRSPRRYRTIAAVIVMILSVSTVFSQKSFAALDPSGTYNVYAMFLLAPVSVGSLLLGPLSGMALGLFAGAMLFLHAHIMPLDFQELLFLTPASSFGLYGSYGLLIGLLFSLLLPRSRTRRGQAVIIVLICLAISLLGSCGASILTPYSGNTAEVILQALINASITSSSCLAAFALIEWAKATSDDISLRQAFRMSIFFVVSLAFFVTATMSFVIVTLNEQHHAKEGVQSEVNYLCIQLKSLSERVAAFDRVISATGVTPEELKNADPHDLELLANPLGDILSGYTMEQTGTVFIVQDGNVIMSDDQRVPVGSNVESLGISIQRAIKTSIERNELVRIIYGGVLTGMVDTDTYRHDTQMAYLLAAQQGPYTVVIIEPSSMIYQDRYGIIFREALITLVLMIAVFVLVNKLLDLTVASRIDQTNEALSRITSGDLSQRVEVTGTREFKSLSSGINQTVDSLKDLISQVERHMEKDLMIARAIQEGVLPKHFPAFPNIDCIDLYALMNAAKEVGGDFYDFFEVDDHTVAFLIADVSGKGIPAALFMMVAKAEIQNRLSLGMGVAEAIAAANDYLSTHNEADMFVTVWAATFDLNTRVVTYVNAGHNYPLLRRGYGGAWQWVKEKSGIFLGPIGGVKFREYTLTLSPGDELVLYTDGVNEAFNVNGEQYGNERLEGYLATHSNERPRELAHGLRADVAAWAEGAEQSDDVTILVFEYTG